jgi:uncharacterized OB-fold protein
MSTSYLSDSIPHSPATQETEPFWDACSQDRLIFQKCRRCSRVTHPPILACPSCQSFDRGWMGAPERATVFSFTWAFTPGHDSVRERLPYNIALVEFPDLSGVRLVSNVVNVKRGELKIGDQVALIWETEGSRRVPRFRKVISDKI